LPGKSFERDQRAGDGFAIEPGLGFCPIAGCDSGKGEAGQSVRELARHVSADRAKPGNGDSFGRQTLELL